MRRSISTTSGSNAAASVKRLLAVGCLTEHVEVGIAGEHAAQPVAHHRMVVDDQRCRIGVVQHLQAECATAGALTTIAGTRAEIAVPPPGSDSTVSDPATPARALAHRRSSRTRPRTASTGR